MRRRANDGAPPNAEGAANDIASKFTALEPSPPHGFELYVGDLFAAGKGLVRAEYELWALQRYTMEPDVAEAVAEMAVATGELVALLKWMQNRLRGIDWEERPELGHGVATEPVALTAVPGGRR